MLCALCDAPLSTTRDRGLTDCAHEFCLACICRQLTDFRNLCPVCGRKVKTVHQLQPESDTVAQDAGAAPASVRFNNAIYVLNVSIWSVDDPARVLADLFHLEQARLIHKGKLLKKGDVWPGTVVQLFGTRKSSLQQANGSASWATMYAPWNLLNAKLLERVTTVFCCPITVLYDFFRSLFVNDAHVERRGYQRLDQGAGGPTPRPQQPQSFSAPGRVASPHLIDLED